ncbi:D-alanyl-D-alanine carboxypeptidase/D-alanyl-D-alanine-endopeptidase [Streptacidiphilus sp. EB129]|uniref:D-alanyl-D-alanine carboxypeptidase/D-alanyl-D-alanine endopeptidase n=1 Tax=Streptacidiphilus sp. EB129 TaxID=3156262 RepID=UPI0035136898
MGTARGDLLRRFALAPVRGVALVAGGLGLALAAGSVAAAGPWQGGQRVEQRGSAHRTGAARAAAAASAQVRPVPPPSWQPAQDVLLPAASAVGSTAPLPTGGGLAASLSTALSASVLGKVSASVLDGATGQSLYASDADNPLTPASTNKLLTAVTALSLLGPGHRFGTRVLSPAPGRLVLVGGGDPTLTGAPTGGDDPQASLATLADRTAAALTATHTATVTLTYDISLFAGGARSPRGVDDNLAPIQSLTVDEGRIDPHTVENAPRYGDPAATAAATFVRLLRQRGITVLGAPTAGTGPAGAPGTAPATASNAAAPSAPLAEVSSQPLSEIVERMLTDSDNDIAETLGHQIALATGRTPTFANGAAAVLQQLSRLGVPLGATRLTDASGLDGGDAVPAAVLTRVLMLAASPAHPELRSVISGLPVLGFAGTLDNPSYTPPSASAGLGVVRAKTGTLKTVNTLAGLVVDRDGRLLVFAFMSNGTAGADAVRGPLGSLAARVAGCGCR